MTLLLAIDSACASCSAAVWDDDVVLAHKFEAMSRGQAENLLPFIEDVLKNAGKELQAMDALAVTMGPGAFTGIRICLSAARGLALATKKPLIGLTTMEALLSAQDISGFTGNVIAVVIETKRQDLYVQYFDTGGAPISDAEAMMPEKIAQDLLEKSGDTSKGKPIFLCGDGATRLHVYLDNLGCDYILAEGNAQPDAKYFGAVALKKFKFQGPAAFMHAPAPLYLRPPDAIPPKPKFLFTKAII